MTGWPATVSELGALFPGAGGRTYLDISVRSLLPEPTRAAVAAYLDGRVMGSGTKEEQWALVERARGGFARLVGAEPDEVAIVKNVSEGLNLFAASLPWQTGDNVVVCPGLEHPNNVFLWYNLRALRGIDVRTVEADDDGRVPVERMASAIDGRTRVVTLPHVTFSPGLISDVGTVSRAARARGALVLVDAAQSVGALRTDVDALGVDALVVATQKSLLALYGFGFLYVRRAVAESLHPCFAARYGMDLGADAHETALGDGGLPFAAGARRFDLGNYNYAGAAAAATSLELIHAVGIEAIEAHVRGLARRLAVGLLDLGLPVAGGPPGDHLAHIVAVGASGGGRHDTADDPAMNALHAHLVAHGVHLSIRRGVLRFSVGVYNTAEDVARVIALCRGWRSGPTPG